MRKCAICGQPLDFPSSDTMNDVCSEKCNDIYVQIPADNIYWDYPDVEFIHGVHRGHYRPAVQPWISKLVRDRKK